MSNLNDSKRWMATLYGWKLIFFKFLSAIGQDERGFKWLGFYEWQKTLKK